MYRRDFLAGSASTAALFAFPLAHVLSEFPTIKVGVLRQIFHFSGYDSMQRFESVQEYSNLKQAYQDLRNGKIDVLISSPTLLSHLKPEFQFMPSQTISDCYSQLGLKSELVGELSPLKIRISNLSFQDLSQWKNRPKAISVVANGFDAVSFEHMGFYLRQEQKMHKLTMQLAEMAKNQLNLTNAYAPALFLNALSLNQKIEILPSKPPFHNLVMVDDFSSSASVIELVYRNSSRPQQFEALQASLKSYLQQDGVFQKKSLDAVLQLPHFTFAEKLPVELRESYAKYNGFYIDTLKADHKANENMANNFKSLIGVL